MLFFASYVIKERADLADLGTAVTAESLRDLVDDIGEHVAQFAGFTVDETDIGPPRQTRLQT